jgi:hypothetical protein
MWRRIAPALVLAVLSPFVAELLLGDIPVRMVVIFPVLAGMYGAGAIVIREIARRTGRGWPTILMLGAAYGFAEEGLGDMSLFDPDFAGHHLLAAGRFLGIGWPWWCYVITLHVVWSIGTSIGLTEALFPARADRPWLGKVGLTVSGAVFVLGLLLVHLTSEYRLAAWQALLSLALVVAASALAFLLPRPRRAGTGPVPAPWLATALVLVAAAAFHLAFRTLPGFWPLAADLVAYLAVAVPVVRWSRRTGWGAPHRLAMVAGTTLAYCGLGFWLAHKDPADLTAQAAYAALALTLLALAAHRLRTTSPAAEPLTTAA